MKRIIALLTAIFTAAAMCSCGSSGKSDSDSSKKSETTTAVTTVAEEEVTTETFTLPSKETFAQIPDEAAESFDYVIEAVKKSHPTEVKGSTRLYGYLGEEDVNDSKCYLFAVYDKKKDVHTEVATVAVTEDSSELYVYNSETLTYVPLEVPEDENVKPEYHWAESDAENSSAVETEADLSSEVAEEVTVETQTEVTDLSSVTE